jgi:hypothetical protein
MRQGCAGSEAPRYTTERRFATCEYQRVSNPFPLATERRFATCEYQRVSNPFPLAPRSRSCKQILLVRIGEELGEFLVEFFEFIEVVGDIFIALVLGGILQQLRVL